MKFCCLKDRGGNVDWAVIPLYLIIKICECISAILFHADSENQLIIVSLIWLEMEISEILSQRLLYGFIVNLSAWELAFITDEWLRAYAAVWLTLNIAFAFVETVAGWSRDKEEDKNKKCKYY